MSNELRLDDGFATFITLSLAPSIKLFEKEVTPPGLTLGGAIETTTMRNSAWRTNAPRKLKSISPTTATVAYATNSVPTLMDSLLGVNQIITVTLPDDSHFQFWGWVEEFTPAANVEGEQPTATITIQPSMRDNDGNEVAPVYYTPDESPL